MNNLDIESIEKDAYKVADSFIEGVNKGEIRMDKINLLADLAFNDDKELSKLALGPILVGLIHNLKKSFKKNEGDVFLKVFPYFIASAIKKSSIIQDWARRVNLSESNITDELYKRSISLRKAKKPLTLEEKNNIRRVIILSRNTIGAEAYINGILISHILKNLKNAEVIFVDSCDVGKHIFSHPRIKSAIGFTNSKGDKISFSWPRHKLPILERLEYTANLSDFISLETKGLNKNEFMVVDADTRLSQTGAMPICDESNHYFIDTVLKSDKEEVKSFGILCNEYLNNLFSTSKTYYPKIHLSQEGIKKAKYFVSKLPDNKIIMVHFGSGLENKTLSLDFEKELTLNLFKYGTPLIIKTFVDWENERFNNLIKFLEENGKKEGRDFFTFQGDLSTFVSLIREVDLCIGYDSQCQHMAAALKTPFITFFTGHINKEFLKRWTPISENFSKIIEVDKKEQKYEAKAMNEFSEGIKKFFTQ